MEILRLTPFLLQLHVPTVLSYLESFNTNLAPIKHVCQFPKLQVISLNAKRRDAMISANIGHFSMTFENAGFIFVFSIYIRAATKLKSFIIQEG